MVVPGAWLSVFNNILGTQEERSTSSTTIALLEDKGLPPIVMLAPDNLTYFSRGVTIGVCLYSLAGLASVLAATVILILIFHRIYVTAEWEALDVSVIALFIAEVLQGIGHSIEFKWLIEGKIYTGPVCNAQGIFIQLGGSAAAIFTLTVAVQTFLIIWRLKTLNRKWIVVVTIVQFIVALLMAVVSFGILKRKPYETFDRYWCWTSPSFFPEQIALLYSWFWVTALGSLILYIPLFLLHFQFIKPGTKWYSPIINVHVRGSRVQQANSRRAWARIEENSAAIPTNPSQVLSKRDGRLWSAILYPVFYCFYVVPLSAVRVHTFYSQYKTGEGSLPPSWTLFVIVCLSLSGVMNAILYRLTRSTFFRPFVADIPTAPVPKMHGYESSSTTPV